MEYSLYPAVLCAWRLSTFSLLVTAFHVFLIVSCSYVKAPSKHLGAQKSSPFRFVVRSGISCILKMWFELVTAPSQTDVIPSAQHCLKSTKQFWNMTDTFVESQRFDILLVDESLSVSAVLLLSAWGQSGAIRKLNLTRARQWKVSRWPLIEQTSIHSRRHILKP